MSRKKPGLTPKQEAFCRAVVKGKTYADAYRSSYNCKGSTNLTIWQESCRMMANPNIASRVQELNARATERLILTKQQWLEKLDRMAMADIRKLFNPQGDVVPIAEIGDAEADLIEGIEVVENFEKVGDKPEHVGYTKKLKLASKRAILKDYGEARGWVDVKEDAGPKTIVLRDFIKQEVHIYGQGQPHTHTGGNGVLDHDTLASNGHGQLPDGVD